MLNRLHLFLTFTLTVLVLGGCGGGLALAPVEGLVTLNGAPVADAAVMFAPQPSGPVATGVTDATGRFTLHTTNDLGALIGEHRVTITKQDIGNLVNGLPGPGGIKITWHVPEKYSRAETSGLTASVKRSGNEISFPLQSP